jgi:hypothetical protein
VLPGSEFAEHATGLLPATYLNPVRLPIFLLLLLLAATAALADDLTVTHISRLPELDYVWGSANPTRDGWPAPGQAIVWCANVKNFSASAVTSGYRWTLDGVTVARGTQTFAANATTPVDLPSAWSFERHRLAFDVDAVPGEESASNNHLEVFTDALSVGLWVEQSLYDYFRAHQHDLGVGSTCWENWAQRLVGFYNDMAKMAVYPETPEGVQDRWRIEKIVVVPDDALPLAPPVVPQRGRDASPGSTQPDVRDRSVDLMWGFRANTVGGYGDTRNAMLANPFYVAPIVIHELGHARYLTDVYGFDLLNQPPAFVTALGVVHATQFQGLMNRDFTFIDRYSAVALNLIAGARATRGNYNEPENLGAFLNDLPAENRLTIRDANGTPLANADVEIFQSKTGMYDEWYATDYDDAPDLVLRTDANGRVLVGRCPFSGDGVVVNSWRGSNTVAVVRVNHALYGFLESAQFNMEYWRGHTQLGDYDVVSGGGDVCGSGGVLVLSAVQNGGATKLSWLGVAGATSYRVMAAPDGGAPQVVTTTQNTAATVRLSGSVYWWIEAERAGGCPSIRSSTMHLAAAPVRSRVVMPK